MPLVVEEGADPDAVINIIVAVAVFLIRVRKLILDVVVGEPPCELPNKSYGLFPRLEPPGPLVIIQIPEIHREDTLQLGLAGNLCYVLCITIRKDERS